VKLLPYQEPHTKKLVASIKANGIAVDGSDAGVGKTYSAAAAAKELGMPVFVVCPKVSVPTWGRVLDGFGVRCHDIVNYEKLRMGSTPWGKFDRRTFKWNVPEGTLIIFDEAHRAKGRDSQNAKMLRDAKGRPLLLLSATLAENPLEMRALTHVTGLCDWWVFFQWCLKNGCRKGRFGIEFDKRRTDVLLQLHEEFFIKRGGRIRIADLGDQFPDTQITAEAMDFGDDIQKVYDEMEAELAALEEAAADDKPAQHLTIQLRARQHVELLKVPGIVSLAKDFLEDGKSVVIFTNFRQTLETLCQKLGTQCAIYGEQPASWRQKCIDDFQENKERVIIVNIQAGGVSVSLHDIHGTHPRVALLCPTFSATELRQALGRVHRSGGTKSLQRILFAAGTVEEKVCARVQAKLDRLDLLNDGDLDASENNLNEVSGPVSDIEQGLTDPMQSATTRTPAPAALPTAAERPHSKHSPSSLENKRKCPGWFNDPDPNKDTSAADRGTLGHFMVEKEDITLAPEDPILTEAAKRCLLFMRRFSKPGTKHYRELHLPIMEQAGHIDHLFAHPDGSADLVDLKFAHNFYRADSAQFWAYMLGVWDRFPGINEITVWVLHPFLDAVDEEKFSRTKDYDRLAATVRVIIEGAESPDPTKFSVGKQCSWCGRLKTCRKWAEFGAEVASRYNEDGKKFSLPAGSVHGSDIEDPETLAVLWRIAPIVAKAADGWRKAALEKKLEGVELPGLELAERSGKREITSAVAAFEAVKDKVKPEDFIEACDVKITALEKVFADSFPRGEKGPSKKVLMGRLLDASAVSSGAPVQMLRELKSQ